MRASTGSAGGHGGKGTNNEKVRAWQWKWRGGQRGKVAAVALRVHEWACDGVQKRVRHGWLPKEERRGVGAPIYRRESEH
jgi:hypothetical protein